MTLYAAPRRRVRVPLPPDVPVTVRLPEAQARRLAWWVASRGRLEPGLVALMPCPHRIVREIRVYSDAPEELSLSVAVAVTLAKIAPTALYRSGGRMRGWIVRGHCAECEDT